jgi:hypothetical protein
MSKENFNKGNDGKELAIIDLAPITSTNREGVLTVEDYLELPYNSNEDDFGVIPLNSPNVVDLIREKSKDESFKVLNDFEVGRICGALGSVAFENARRYKKSGCSKEYEQLSQKERQYIISRTLGFSTCVIGSLVGYDKNKKCLTSDHEDSQVIQTEILQRVVTDNEEE